MKCLLFADCDGAFLQDDCLRWGQPSPQKSSKLSCLRCYWTKLYIKPFSPSSQPKHQSFNNASSLSAAPTFCSAAITGACCRAKIAIMYNHQVILCPSTPNDLTKLKRSSSRMIWNSKWYRANKTACLWFLWKLRFCNWIGLWRNQNMMKGTKYKFDSVLWSACCLPIAMVLFCRMTVCVGVNLVLKSLQNLSCLRFYWTKLYIKPFSPSSQPKHQSFNNASSLSAAPTFCSAAITGACCRAKIAIMYNHQVILCPSTPNDLTKLKRSSSRMIWNSKWYRANKTACLWFLWKLRFCNWIGLWQNQNMMKGTKYKFDSVLWSACCLPIAMVLFCRMTACVGVNLVLKSLQNFHVFVAIEQNST